MSETEVATGGRHASNLELFLDLVFVFAITQLATLIGHDPTVAGTSKGVLIAFLVWWLWSQFTWAGAAADLQDRIASRVLILCLIPVTLVMAVALAESFGATGRWFGVSYFGVQVLVLAIQGAFAWGDPVLRRTFLAFTRVALVSPTLVMIGGLLDGDVRVAVWVAAAGVNLVAAVLGGSGEWAIDPTHFAERHALFVIIALGEVVVAVGATGYELSVENGLDGELVLAIVVAALGAAVMWWTYFGFVPSVGEHRLGSVAPAQRGRLARDVYTLGHFPLVLGIVLFAVVAKHMLEHPFDPLISSDRWLLALSVVTFAGGLFVMRLRLVGRPSLERLATIALTVVLCTFGNEIDGVVVVGAVVVLYAAAQAIRTQLVAHGADEPRPPRR